VKPFNNILRIGIDFDNTIVCYDSIFHRVALERGLIPPSVPVNKSEVRNYLRAAGREPAWTEMQGVVYGSRMIEAEAFPGALDFFSRGRASGFELFIISHKTRRPFLGEPFDLHQSAVDWLESKGFFRPPIAIPRDRVFFELSREEKLNRIQSCGCQLFLDDLPEFLLEPGFPRSVRRVLFDPGNLYPNDGENRFARVTSWKGFQQQIEHEHGG
jgi:hypothetical protein